MLWLFVSHFGVLECYLYECGFFRHSGQMEWPSPLSCAIWGFCDIVRKRMGGGGGGWRVEAVLIRKIYFWESTRREIREKKPILWNCHLLWEKGRNQSVGDGLEP